MILELSGICTSNRNRFFVVLDSSHSNGQQDSFSHVAFWRSPNWLFSRYFCPNLLLTPCKQNAMFAWTTFQMTAKNKHYIQEPSYFSEKLKIFKMHIFDDWFFGNIPEQSSPSPTATFFVHLNNLSSNSGDVSEPFCFKKWRWSHP